MYAGASFCSCWLQQGAQLTGPVVTLRAAAVTALLLYISMPDDAQSVRAGLAAHHMVCGLGSSTGAAFSGTQLTFGFIAY